MKKLISLILTAVLLASCLPMSIFAATTEDDNMGPAYVEKTETDMAPDDSVDGQHYYSEPGEAITILCDAEKRVTTDVNSGIALFRFIPETDGTYVFYSYDNDLDTYGYVYDENMELLDTDDDDGGSLNFKVVVEMTAGETYYLKSSFYDYGYEGGYWVMVTKAPLAESVNIMPYDDTVLFAGYTTWLYAEFSPENCAEEELSWSSNNPSVVSIDENGYIEALSVGEATITVTTENGLTDSITITVKAPTVIEFDTLTTAILTPAEPLNAYSFTPDEDGQYIVRVEGDYCVDTEIYDPDGYCINSDVGYYFDFYVEMVAGGTYTIYSSLSDEASECSYNVRIIKRGPAEAVNIRPDRDLVLYIGSSYILNAEFLPEDSIEEYCEWSSNAPTVATINEYGEVFALSEGVATVTVTTENGLTDSTNVIVKAPTVIGLDETMNATLSGQYEESMFSFTPEEDWDYSIKIESDDYTFTYVRDSEDNYFTNNDGDNYTIIVGMVAGETYRITTYTSYNVVTPFEYSITIEKCPRATGIEIEKPPYAYVGLEENLWSEFYPENASREHLTWYSDNEAIATLEEAAEGYIDVNFLSAGTVTITVETESGLSDSVTINVMEIPLLTEEQPVYMTISNNYSRYAKFIPAESGVYHIYPSDYYNGNEVYLCLYNEHMNHLASAYNNDTLEYEFEAGETYFIETYFNSWWEDRDCSYYINAAKAVPATGITLDIGTEYSGYVGTSVYAEVVFDPEHAIRGEISWSSSDDDIVCVDEYGEILLKSVGTATITATTENSLTAQCVITVKDHDRIELNEEKTVSVDSGIGHYYTYFYFTPEEDGYYSFYSYERSGDPFGYIYTDDMEQLAYNDDSNELNFRVSGMLEAGVTYLLGVGFYDSDSPQSVKVTVEMTKYMTSLELVSMPDRTEYVKGYAQEAINRNGYDGLKLKATWSDGSTTDWEYNYNWSIEGETISCNTYELDEYGKVTLTCGEASLVLTFTLIDNPVERIELVSGTTYTYVENYDGYIDYNEDGEFFHYYTKPHTDAKIRIVYTDGTSKTANFGDIVDGYSFSLYHNQHDEPWKVGDDNKLYISYLGHKVLLPITLRENKVKSIEVVSGKVTCIENSYGYEMVSGGYYYYYDMPEDVTIKITYLDDTSKTVNIRDVVDGYSFSWTHNQYDEPWTLGDDNYITLSYLGFEAHLTVSVIESPVERIEITSAPGREYIYGDIEYGYLYSDGYYEFYPTDMSGLAFTVYYKNGTQKNFTDEDIDDDDQIDGYGYELNYSFEDLSPGNFPVEFMYMGRTAEYTVVLRESPVKSITMTKAPDKTEYEERYEPDFLGAEFLITYVGGATKTVTLNEDNIFYPPFEYYRGCEIEVDGHKLFIVRYYGETGRYFVASYLGASCEIRDIIFTENREIGSVKLDTVTSCGDNMIVEVTYADGTSEKLTTELVDSYEYQYDYLGIEAYAKTENGLLYYHIETHMDNDGNVIKYVVWIFGEKITIHPNGKSISGSLNGHGAEGEIKVQLLNDAGEVMYETTTMNGNYTFDNVVPGDYTLRVVKKGTNATKIPVSVGEEDVAVEDVKVSKLGDVDSDGSCSMTDLLAMRKYMLGMISEGDGFDKNAACTNDGTTVSMVDLLNLRKYMLGIINEFPFGS